MRFVLTVLGFWPEEPARLHLALRAAHHLQQLQNITFWDRLTEMIALGVFAANRAQEGCFLGMLDAFRHDFFREFVGEGHDRAHDGRARRCVTGAHEFTIDLDRVEWKTLQIGQRRVARAKIIQGQISTRPAQNLQHFDGLLRVFHHQRFSDFEPERAARHDVAAENVADLLD